MNEFDAARLDDLRLALARLPRATLASLPTPLDPMPRLGRALGGPSLWIKRDDLTGLATGGNKTRMFEYVLGRAIAEGKDTVIGGAAVQSNYCRQLAAASARLGLECHLILRKVRGASDEDIQGGLLIDLLVGANVELITDEGGWTELGRRIRAAARQLESQGKKVLVAWIGDEPGLSLHACGYVQAAIEILDQANSAGIRIDDLWLCSSAATQAGLALAFKHIGSPIRLVGVPPLTSPLTPGSSFPEYFTNIGNQCAALLGLDTRLSPDDFCSLTDYVGSKYAELTDEAREAMRMFGTCEGILLDPVYTAKAAAGFVDYIRKGRIDKKRTVIFLHTGGIPALFAYAHSLNLKVE